MYKSVRGLGLKIRLWNVQYENPYFSSRAVEARCQSIPVLYLSPKTRNVSYTK